MKGTENGVAKRQTLRVFEAFAGIGAQATALKRLKPFLEELNVDCEIVGISEWFVNALIAYDKLHCDSGQPEFEIPSKEVMLNELKDFEFSTDSVHPIPSLKRLPEKKLRQLYIAHKRTRNFGSITKLDPNELPPMDLLVYSFPCQDLSTGGWARGMSRESGTRSSLIWQIERILKALATKNSLPKYLVLENVRAITSPRYQADFSEWLQFLESLGYHNSKPQILNALEYGIPQRRERAFVLSMLEEIPVDFDESLRASKTKYPPVRKFLFRDYSNPTYRKEALDAYIRPTPSRMIMWDKNGVEEDELLKPDTHAWTITCNFDRTETSLILRLPPDIVDVKEEDRGQPCFRLLTNREAFLLMGFKSEEYDLLKSLGFSYRQENKLIGNSIVVNVLQAIFREVLRHWSERTRRETE